VNRKPCLRNVSGINRAPFKRTGIETGFFYSCLFDFRHVRGIAQV
jgi:hypothetical protein